MLKKLQKTLVKEKQKLKIEKKKCTKKISDEKKRCNLRIKKEKDKCKKTLDKLKGRKTQIKPIVLPDKFKGIAENCALNTKVWIKQKQRLGLGDYGSVYVACKVDNCEYAMKITKNKQAMIAFKNEVQALKELQGIKGIPKLHAAWTCKGKGYFVLDKLKPINKSNKTITQIYKWMGNMRKKLYKKGWIHIDIKRNNIMCDNKNNLLLIDFGIAVKKGKNYNNSLPFFKVIGLSKKKLKYKWKFNDFIIPENLNYELLLQNNDIKRNKAKKAWEAFWDNNIK